MPIPIIPIIWAALVALVFGAGAAIAVNWDAIVLALTGKTLAVLGARRVGKTTLIKFLTEGVVSEKYEATQGAVKTSGKRFALGELRLDVKAGRDVGGGKDNWGQWREIVEKADYVLYLVRFDQLSGSDEAERIRRDLGQIQEWLASRSTRPPFWLLITHVDLDPNYREPDDAARNHLGTELAKHPLIKEALIRGRNGDPRGSLLVGSLRTQQDAELLTAAWLGQVGGST